ncbi:DUF3040 domain-containing protein [Spirillospora sp. NPDC127200]
MSEHEAAVLARIGTRLEREDPPLAARMSTLASAGQDLATWRPPRAAVVVASVAVSVSVFMIVMMMVVMA